MLQTAKCSCNLLRLPTQEAKRISTDISTVQNLIFRVFSSFNEDKYRNNALKYAKILFFEILSYQLFMVICQSHLMLILYIASAIKTALLRNLRSNQQVVRNSAVFHVRDVASRYSVMHNHWNLWQSNYMKQIHSSEAGRSPTAFCGPWDFITIITEVLHLTPSWKKLFKSVCSYTTL